MTPQEVYDKLQARYVFIAEGIFDSYEVTDKLFSALEKQIPKKPIISVHKYIDGETMREGEYKLKHCPCCWENGKIGYFESLIDKGTKYCIRCGQALDWSEE